MEYLHYIIFIVGFRIKSLRKVKIREVYDNHENV